MVYNGVMETVLFKNFADAADAAVSGLSHRQVNLNINRVLLVPDKYTLNFERRLFSGGGALDLEVLTLSRLQVQVAPSAALSKEGGIMLLKRAIDRVKNELVFYKRAAAFPGFARQAYDTITQLKASLKTPEDFDGEYSRALADKMHDLKLIYSAYLAEDLSRADAAGRFMALCDAAPTSEYINNAVIYAVGFADLTALARHTLEVLSRSCKEFRFFDVEGEPEPCKNAKVFSAPDYVSEVKAVAREIRALAVRGESFEDMAVIAPSLPQVVRIFDEYGVPFNADVKLALGAAPLVRALKCLYELRGGGFFREHMIELSKNYYSDVPAECARAFELYVLERAVDYKGFLSPFENEEAERARALLVSEVEAFSHAHDFVSACEEFFAAHASEAKADEEATLTGVSVFPKVHALIDLCARFGDGFYSGELFFDAADNMSVSALPILSGGVDVCGADALRSRRVKHLFALGCNEGVLPAVTEDSALLSDFDADEAGFQLSPSAEDVNRRSRYDLEFAFSACKNLYAYYSESERAAAFVKNLGAAISLEDEKLALIHSTSAAKIADYTSCASGAREALLSRDFDWQASCYDALKATDSLGTLFGSARLEPPCDGKKSIRSARIAVTRIQSYFDCPYKHFVRYSLCADKRKRGGIRALEVGTIVHAVMKKFVLKPEWNVSREAISLIVEEVLAEQKGLYGLTDAVKQRLISASCYFAAKVKVQFALGRYTVRSTETEFGFGENPPEFLKIHSSPDVYLYGVIDRIDECDGVERIIDYKSSNTKFEASNVYHGRTLQLIIYALNERGRGEKLSGFFYSPLVYRFAKTPPSEFNGLAVADPEQLLNYDKNYEVQEGESYTSPLIGVKMKNDGGSYVIKGGSTISSEGFNCVIDYAAAVASGAVDEICDGFTQPLPYAKGRVTACDYCDAKGVCFKRKYRFAVKADISSCLSRGEFTSGAEDEE